MVATIALDVVIGLAALTLLIYRQLRTRRIRSANAYRPVLILGVIGVVQTASFTGKNPVPDVAWVLLAASLVTAAVFGWLRGRQVHVWVGPDGPLRKGNAVTCALWVAAVGVHLLIDIGGGAAFAVPSGFGTASILIYLAVTLGVQQVVLQQRAASVSPGWSSGWPSGWS